MAHKRKAKAARAQVGKRTKNIAVNAIPSPPAGTVAPGATPSLALPGRLVELLGQGPRQNLIQAASSAPKGVSNQSPPGLPGRVALIPPSRKTPRTGPKGPRTARKGPRYGR